MQYRIFSNAEAGDQLCYQVKDGDKVIKEDKSTFKFTGFGNFIHPHSLKQQEWLLNILASNDIFITVKTVPTTEDFGADGSETSVEHMDLPPVPISKDKNGYYLVQDTEMGRGWAFLIKLTPDGIREVIEEDHRDNLLDWLSEGDWIRSFGIDYKQEEIADQSFWRNR